MHRGPLAAAVLLASCVYPRPCVFPELGLNLPFDDTTERLVVQGNSASFSHHDEQSFAWDFEMPEGTPVLAAGDGIVVEAVDGYSDGGPDISFIDRANGIVIDHGGGRFSIYSHLQRSGVLVRVGQQVARGQLIGRSGNTGFTSGPHLHFAVVDHRGRSLPVCFADVDIGAPIQGVSYRHVSVAPSSTGRDRVLTPSAPSLLPRDTFAENGILLNADIPARAFMGGEKIDAVAVRPAKIALAVF